MSGPLMAGPPHGGQPVLAAGTQLERARSAMIMVHGRGASAEDIITLSEEFPDSDIAYLAPQAAGSVWYPLSFLSPIAANEPGLSSGLAVLQEIEVRVQDAGIASERVILLGFSQGACLVLEYAARNARRYGGVAGLSGGLIGPDGAPRDYSGSFKGAPVFLGCSVTDPHIPRHRVEQTNEIFRKLGAEVTMRLYPEPGHSVNEDEIVFVRTMIASLEKSIDTR
jgi:phospholipase/carboxylesterase